MSESLFSYGALQKESVQLSLFKKIFRVSPDTLEGYILSEIEITDESFLGTGEGKFQKTLISTDDKADIITGTVLELTNEELSIADKFEPDNYKRIKVTLVSGKEAWIYLVLP